MYTFHNKCFPNSNTFLFLTLPLKPQARAYKSYAPSLLQMKLMRGPQIDLVRISANWPSELTKLVTMRPENIFSLIKWQSTSMCLVLSWNTRLDAIWSAAWLSRMTFIFAPPPNFNSCNNCFNHTNSHVARAIARYSASALDLETTTCFLLFQDIRLPPIRTQYPIVERLSEGEPA